MQLTNDTLDVIETAINNGNRAQIVLRTNGDITAHEVTSCNFILPSDGVTIGLISDAETLAAAAEWEYDQADLVNRWPLVELMHEIF